MSVDRMDRETRRGPRGAEESLPPLAAIAFALFAFTVVPVIAAGGGGSDGLSDAEGPMVSDVNVVPNPVQPGIVWVAAIATDALSNISAAEFWIDATGANGASKFLMSAADGSYDDAATEDVWWAGPYTAFAFGLQGGAHTLYVHARDAAGNWGPFAMFVFMLGSPSVGPEVTILEATPATVPHGAPMRVAAVLEDTSRKVVVAAEFFLDGLGPDGTGTPLEAVDAFNSPLEAATWTGILSAAPGTHTIYVHARNDLGAWGPARGVTFTASSPAFSLLHTADPADARPGELVTYTVRFENRGNAAATTVSVNFDLPASVAFVDATAAEIGGNRSGTVFTFLNVQPGTYAFSVRAEVALGATDGTSLRAIASLAFTNEVGFNYSTVTAGAGGTVIAPELAVWMSGTPNAFAAESATLTVHLENTGTRTIPFTDIALPGSSWTDLESDTAARVGGFPNGPGQWRIQGLRPGSHEFEIRERIAANAPDGIAVTRTLTASYVPRIGDSTVVSAAWDLFLQRPSFTLTASVDRATVEAGQQVAVSVTYTNIGSVRAGGVALRLLLPSALVLAGGDAPLRTVGSEHTWERADVEPGTHTLTIILEAIESTTANIPFELTYASPGGEPLGAVSTGITVDVVAAQAPPPATTTTTDTAVPLAVAATGVSVLGLFATERGKSAFFLLLVPLYTRLQRDHLLDHETRGMIRGYIVANPGDHYNSIKDALELPNGTLAYHLQVLEKEYIVKSVKDGKFRRYYPSEMRLPMSGEPTKIQRVVLDLVRTNPGITPRDAAGLLGLSSSTVSYHLEKLQELDRVETRREGITKRLYVRGDLESQ